MQWDTMCRIGYCNNRVGFGKGIGMQGKGNEKGYHLVQRYGMGYYTL